MSTAWDPAFFQRLRYSPLLQAALLFLLILVLQIPVLFLAELVGQRDRTRAEAIGEIARHWGGRQAIRGPYLVVPYTYLQRQGTDASASLSERRSALTFLAKDLSIEGVLNARTLYRGIFEAPVYEAEIRLAGAFAPLDIGDLPADADRVEWERAQIALEVADPRAVQDAVILLWQGREIAFQPGAGLRGADRHGMHARVPDAAPGKAPAFAASLRIRGSSEMRFAPLAEMTEARLASAWPHPSFQGAWLPAEREVDEAGFSAYWRIPHLGRNYPQRWTGAAFEEAIDASQFGADLISPVDAYRQVDRSLKYQLLFVGLTFTAVWLFEILAGARVHLIQYALIGAALCLFFLLELSLAEHFGFVLAYWLAAFVVAAMAGLYGRAALGSRARAAGLTGVTLGLYGLLFALLRVQDYALLIGSAGLAAVLAAVMYFTRNVDWFSLPERQG